MRLAAPFARWSPLLVAISLAIAANTASAAVTLYSGRLDDPLNTALVGSDPAPSAPSFVDAYAIANNVALYGLTVPVSGPVRFESLGFALGGVDPYFSIFAGAGPGATFVDSNYIQAFSTGGDFDLTRSLAAGTYTLALGAYANESFAENYGSGTLGDGFIAFGTPSSLGQGIYSLRVTTVPEPPTPLLLAASVVALVVGRRAFPQARRR